jgi:uncharacterized membrane protein
VLLLATLAVGLMAGVFALYAHTIMPSLGETDDRTFVAAFQEIDRAIVNPLFMPVFLGALLLTAAAMLLELRQPERPALPWLLLALVLYTAVVVVTVGINVPLNDEIKAAGHPDRIADLAAVRRDFDESRWTSWNIVRTVAATAAFGCLAWSLVLWGRTSARELQPTAGRRATYSRTE